MSHAATEGRLAALNIVLAYGSWMMREPMNKCHSYSYVSRYNLACCLHKRPSALGLQAAVAQAMYAGRQASSCVCVCCVLRFVVPWALTWYMGGRVCVCASGWLLGHSSQAVGLIEFAKRHLDKSGDDVGLSLHAVVAFLSVLTCGASDAIKSKPPPGLSSRATGNLRAAANFVGQQLGCVQLYSVVWFFLFVTFVCVKHSWVLPPLRFHNRLAVAFLRQQAVKLPISLEDPGILYAGMEPGAFESEAPINFLEHVDIVAQIQGNHMVIPSTPVNVSACQACVACCCCCWWYYCHYCCKRVDSHGAGHHHPTSCFDSFAHLLQAFLSAAQALQELTTGTNVNAALNFARRSVSLLKVSECV